MFMKRLDEIDKQNQIKTERISHKHIEIYLNIFASYNNIAASHLEI